MSDNFPTLVSGASQPTDAQRAEWARLDQLVREFWAAPAEERPGLLEAEPKLFRRVCCEECGRINESEDDF